MNIINCKNFAPKGPTINCIPGMPLYTMCIYPEMQILETLSNKCTVCICVQLKPWNAESDANCTFMYHNANLSTCEGPKAVVGSVLSCSRISVEL